MGTLPLPGTLYPWNSLWLKASAKCKMSFKPRFPDSLQHKQSFLLDRLPTVRLRKSGNLQSTVSSEDLTVTSFTVLQLEYNVLKWENVSYTVVNHLKSSALLPLASLRVHVCTGCYFNYQTSTYTTRVEIRVQLPSQDWISISWTIQHYIRRRSSVSSWFCSWLFCCRDQQHAV